MDNNQDNKGIPFKEFLDKSTNLITIFGIFNALFIYATTITLKTAASFLLPTLFFLSLFVWFELILFALDSSNGSKKYEIFYFCCCTIELGLVVYFSVAFSPLLVMLGIFVLFLVLAYLIMHLLIWLYPKKILILFKKKRKVLTLITVFISFIIAVIIIKLLAPVFAILFKNLPTEYLLPK